MKVQAGALDKTRGCPCIEPNDDTTRTGACSTIIGYPAGSRFASVSPGRLNPPSRRRSSFFLYLVTFLLRQMCSVRATSMLYESRRCGCVQQCISYKHYMCFFMVILSRCCGDIGGSRPGGWEDCGPCAGSLCRVLDTKGGIRILMKEQKGRKLASAISKWGQKKPKSRNTGNPKGLHTWKSRGKLGTRFISSYVANNAAVKNFAQQRFRSSAAGAQLHSRSVSYHSPR